MSVVARAKRAVAGIAELHCFCCRLAVAFQLCTDRVVLVLADFLQF